MGEKAPAYPAAKNDNCTAIAVKRMRLHQKWSIGLLWPLLVPVVLSAQQPDPAVIIRDLDAANQSRFDNVLGFTDVEHYAVFRGDDQAHPAAEMTVRISYTKGVGKSYVILSQSGSSAHSEESPCSRFSTTRRPSTIPPRSPSPGSRLQTTK